MMNKFERKLLFCSKSQRAKWLHRLRRELAKERPSIFIGNEFQRVPATVYKKANCPNAVIRVSTNPVRDCGKNDVMYHF